MQEIVVGGGSVSDIPYLSDMVQFDQKPRSAVTTSLHRNNPEIVFTQQHSYLYCSFTNSGF